ncbi:DUF2778 domain-containing protein [Azohydromonas caseinilytica]|uniref:DUF2778 domain-containing protein n=1 Tax=Azohydromonas caseinilytica TaxID=2728836 RepID=A0A848F484_9BURK|nr:DUF2778 domain-containing protein [Azohydromonas caseinilytica]NML13429.1 DUF2778 domain-containing protein [Azohydromonas caseinilytica]
MHRCTFVLNDKPMSSFTIGATSFPAFSGLGDFVNQRSRACTAGKGAIPPGSYYIFDRQSGGLLGPLRDLFSDHSNWFALHAIDEKIDDETWCNQVKRGAFRLHPKGTFGISQGCIVIDQSADYQLLRAMLRSSSPTAVPGSSLKAYGTVVVR